MLTKQLNIVSFDVPFPPNYGGIIDVFYKIKELHNLGVDIYLHTFNNGMETQIELLKYCKKVYYYKRDLNFKKVFFQLPYIVKTRESEELTENLLANNFPILFEGLHTTSPLLNTKFKNRTIIVRTHNIEHKYYNGLAKSETNIFKKLYFKTEAAKLKKYEIILNKADYIFTISPSEQQYFSKLFPSKPTYLPAFHGNCNVNSKLGKGKYAIYNGDIRIADNLKACRYLIQIFSKIDFPLIISSSFEKKYLLKLIKQYKNISFIKTSNKHENRRFTLQCTYKFIANISKYRYKIKTYKCAF